MRGHGEATDAMVCGIISVVLELLAGASLFVQAPDGSMAQRSLELLTYGLAAAGLALGVASIVIASRSIARDGRSGRGIAGLVLGIVGVIPGAVVCALLVVFAMH